MRVLVAPEPAPWIRPLLDRDGPDVARETLVIAPWALPKSRIAGLLPARLRTAWQRRTLEQHRVRFVPGWPVLDAVVRRAGAAAAIAWRLEQRVAIDALVAKLLPNADEIEEIIAPSVAALRTFAATPKAKHVLVEDLPGLRQLHADLDVAARALPDCGFLRNFRARDGIVVRQEREYVLATEILVRGHFAKRRAERAGAPSSALGRLPEPDTLRLPALRHDPRSRYLLLAGTTASRFGLEVALGAMKTLEPEVRLLCRRGPGSCESSLDDARLEFLAPGAPVPPVRAVLAPSWVESSPAEIPAAIAAGVPVIATTRALGWHRPGPGIHEFAPNPEKTRQRGQATLLQMFSGAREILEAQERSGASRDAG